MEAEKQMYLCLLHFWLWLIPTTLIGGFSALTSLLLLCLGSLLGLAFLSSKGFEEALTIGMCVTPSGSSTDYFSMDPISVYTVSIIIFYFSLKGSFHSALFDTARPKGHFGEGF